MWIALVVIIVAVYLLPTLAGLWLRVPGLWLILFVNLFLGWTIAGWVTALMWVVKYVRERDARTERARLDDGRGLRRPY